MDQGGEDENGDEVATDAGDGGDGGAVAEQGNGHQQHFDGHGPRDDADVGNEEASDAGAYGADPIGADDLGHGRIRLERGKRKGCEQGAGDQEQRCGLSAPAKGRALRVGVGAYLCFRPGFRGSMGRREQRCGHSGGVHSLAHLFDKAKKPADVVLRENI